MHKKTLTVILLMSLFIQSLTIVGGNKKNGGWLEKDIENFDIVLDKNIDKSGDVLTAAASASGAAFITGIATAVKTQAAVALTAAKGVAIVAAPYVAGGAVVIAAGYGGYKYYQSRQPSEEKVQNERAYRDLQAEKSLEDCLLNNKNNLFNEHQFPVKCDNEFIKFSLIAGEKRAQEKLNAFTFATTRH